MDRAGGDYLKSNGFSEHPTISTSGDADDGCPELAGKIYWPIDERQNRWLVEIECCDYTLHALVEGEHNLLRLLFSPPFASAFGGASAALRGLHAIAARSFRDWHGHEAPTSIEHRDLGYACDRCDPDGRGHRNEQRKAREKMRADAEARKLKQAESSQ